MFDRLELLIGGCALDKLSNARVLLVGVGGVGGFALEGLVRSGVGHITIIDGDIFSESNLNRQIICNKDDIGKSKVECAIKRAKSINGNIDIEGLNWFINEENINILGNYDYIINACDDASASILLIKYAQDNNIPIILALGTGNRLNPSGVCITTLDKTKNDPYAKKMRSLVKKNNLDIKIPVVCSDNLPIYKGSVVVSSIFVPGVAGLNLAYYVINELIK